MAEPAGTAGAKGTAGSKFTHFVVPIILSGRSFNVELFDDTHVAQQQSGTRQPCNTSILDSRSMIHAGARNLKHRIAHLHQVQTINDGMQHLRVGGGESEHCGFLRYVTHVYRAG